jgi:hypothetical protein
MCSNTAPSQAAFLVNLRKPMPLAQKLHLLRRNTWIKISMHQTCCGHPGEPGC